MPAPSVTGRGCSTLSYGGQEKGVTAEGAICTPPSPAEVEAVRRLVAATPTNRTFREAWGLQVDRSSGPAAESDNNTASKDALEWSYLITPDFQVRSQMTARMVEMEGCEHVVEVGGYLTPIERYLVGGSGVARLTNIEPGYSRAPLSNVLLPGGRCVRALSLPLTLSEYLAAAELARGSSSSTAGALLYGGGGGPSYSGRQDAVCVVALGYSVPHRDGDADYGLMSDAQWVALETSTNSVHNEVALNLTVALLTQPPGAATHRLVTDTRLQLRDPHADQHRHGDNSRRRLVTLRRVLRREEQAAAYLAAAAAATGGRRHTPALSQWEGSNGQALCATVSDFSAALCPSRAAPQDYWIWKALLEARQFTPSVVAVEFNPNFPNTQAVTVPRNDSAVWDGSRHYGASLAAFVGLAAGHGYCYCYNLAFTHALFVRCELLHPLDRALELPPETQARGFTLHKPDPLSRSWEEVQLASE
ncbi:hypothetical protein CHLRE_09g386746v5 [Chlamydomonas reinhardtii]|uniref:Uncharacterized protein n=1 Tax=Chlamydomonas reinhardtii TaxID=3055 RepID=A0A2K3DCH0_CHLRE|nr:uncharacterized protein CHLRE_09g386746v5 [Chlamydomonas reinhardtii]PNW78225.1 hypothetical protein CHLRE_09g386746v5 [Chlamydomonas reinhardtii]